MYKKHVKESDHVVFISDKGEVSAILANGFIENLGMKTKVLLSLDLEQTYWRTFLNNCQLFVVLESLRVYFRVFGTDHWLNHLSDLFFDL